MNSIQRIQNIKTDAYDKHLNGLLADDVPYETAVTQTNAYFAEVENKRLNLTDASN